MNDQHVKSLECLLSNYFYFEPSSWENDWRHLNGTSLCDSKKTKQARRLAKELFEEEKHQVFKFSDGDNIVDKFIKKKYGNLHLKSRYVDFLEEHTNKLISKLHIRPTVQISEDDSLNYHFKRLLLGV